jgi:flagellar FliL protein
VSDENTKPKKSKAMLFGMIAALLMGGGGAFATYSGMVTLPFGGKSESSSGNAMSVKDEAVYVELDPILVDLGRGGRSGRLRVSLIIETTSAKRSDIDNRKYQIGDTLYSFLRAVRQEDLRDPSRTDLLRSRILRRVILETPPGAVSDVLISEFVVL